MKVFFYFELQVNIYYLMTMSLNSFIQQNIDTTID